MSVRRALSFSFAAVILFVSTGAGLAANMREGREGPFSPQGPTNIINPIGIAFPICNLGSVAEVNPAIAYDATHDDYLSVWYNDRTSNDDIMAQFFSKNGALIGGPFYIATGGATIDRRYPRVAYDVLDNKFLVVWEQYDSNKGYSIHGSRLDWNGAVLDADITIEVDGYSIYLPAKPVVAYANTSDKFLVVWRELSQTVPAYNNIYGRIVLSSGALGSGVIPIAQADGDHTMEVPDLAYNLGRNEYLVAWQQLDPNAGLTDIWSRRVSGEGLALGAGPIVVAGYTKSSSSPAVAVLPVQPDGQYLVVWESNYKPNDRDVMGRLVASNGTPNQGDISISVTDNVDELQPDVAASPTRGAYLVAWKEVIFPFSSIYARLVTPDGKTAGESFSLGGIAAGNPRLAAGRLGDFAMVYHDVNLALDWGTYGWLIGNRAYLPKVIK
jgi:hypothetical protein